MRLSLNNAQDYAANLRVDSPLVALGEQLTRTSTIHCGSFSRLLVDATKLSSMVGPLRSKLTTAPQALSSDLNMGFPFFDKTTSSCFQLLSTSTPASWDVKHLLLNVAQSAAYLRPERRTSSIGQ